MWTTAGGKWALPGRKMLFRLILVYGGFRLLFEANNLGLKEKPFECNQLTLLVIAQQ